MRRSPILVGIFLLVALAAYSTYWWVAAGKIEDAASAWARAAHERQLDVSWQSIRVTGYPFAFELKLGGTVASDKAVDPQVELHAPTLLARVRPWNFREVRLATPEGIATLLGQEPAPLARFGAASADATVALDGDGAATIWLNFYQPTSNAPLSLSARVARAWVMLPARPAVAHAGPAVGLLITALSLPAAPPEFSPSIDELGLGVTVMGALPAGPLREAAAVWRDSGGALELDHLDLRWGELGVTGSGTLALDSELQPVGGFSGAVSGYDKLMSALVAAGRIKASDARIARLALAMIGKIGPDGRPEITTSLTIQAGQMFLGPAKLGRAPHIDW